MDRRSQLTGAIAYIDDIDDIDGRTALRSRRLYIERTRFQTEIGISPFGRGTTR